MGIRCLRDFDVSGRVIQDFQQCLETVVAPWKSKFHQLHTVTQTVSNIHLVQSPDCDGRGVPGAPGDRLVDVHFNDGTGELGPRNWYYTLATNTIEVRAGDMDRDGDLDLLIAGQLSQNVAWFENPKK